MTKNNPQKNNLQTVKPLRIVDEKLRASIGTKRKRGLND